MSRGNILIVTMLLGLAIPQAAFAQQSDPFVGTWQLNLAKSKYSPGPPPRSQTVNNQAEGQGQKVTVTGVAANGNPVSNTITGVFDGVPHPVVGNPNMDAYASTKIDAYTHIYSETKAGKLIGSMTIVISPDGKTLTSTYARINANGQKFGYGTSIRSSSFTRGAISLRRTATRASGDNPLIARSSAKIASNFCTASKAIGEIVLGLPLRAFDAMSASSNSLRRACAQQPASVIGPGFRFAS